MIEIMTTMMERIARLEHRLSTMVQHGPVAKVDAKKQLARLKLNGGEGGEEYLSPWVPYGQIAGALRAHIPVTEGQNMTLFSPTGDPAQGLILPFTFNNKFKSPSEKADENVITYGNVKVELRESELIATVGGTQFKLTADGVEYLGGSVKHDGKDVGKTHVHSGVQTGSAKTGVPAN